jgi:hypothetical protein
MTDRSTRAFPLLILLLLCAALVPTLVAEEENKEEPRAETPKENEEVVVGPASPERLKELLDVYKDAVVAKNADHVRKALEELLAHDNPPLVDIAIKQLRYKLSSEDRKVVLADARARGVRKPKLRNAMLARKEETVQIVAAQLCANFPGDKKVSSAVAKLFLHKPTREDKPQLASHLIETMGKLGYTKLWKEIESEFRSFRNKEIMRASVRYFGLTKEKRVAKMLCDHIDEPAPGNVNDPNNPPASYWKARWDAWSYMRDDVVIALREITGQTFDTSKQARDWIKDHGRRIGIR